MRRSASCRWPRLPIRSPRASVTMSSPNGVTRFWSGMTRSRYHHRMTLDRLAYPALLVVDMQNDFVRVGAPLEVPEARDTIPVHRRLLEFCRERRVPVVYTKFIAGPLRTLILEWSPSL